MIKKQFEFKPPKVLIEAEAYINEYLKNHNDQIDFDDWDAECIKQYSIVSHKYLMQEEQFWQWLAEQQEEISFFELDTRDTGPLWENFLTIYFNEDEPIEIGWYVYRPKAAIKRMCKKYGIAPKHINNTYCLEKD